MGQTRAFNEVKALLNRLDRSIDEAREKRLTGDRPAAAPVQSAPATPPPQPVQSVMPSPPPPPAKVSGPYGRARPLRPSGNTPGWRS